MRIGGEAPAKAMTGLPVGAPTFLAASIFAFVVLGSVLEGIPAVVAIRQVG